MNSRKLNIRRILFLTLIIILSGSSTLFPQNYNIKTFTTDNGLSHNNVREMVFDSTGFLWIATWDGLNRYDGHVFRQYHHIPGDSTSLPYFSVRGLIIDGSDNLWVLTDNGNIARFNREKNDFTKITRINGEKVPPIPNLACDSNGDVWLISFKSIYLFNHTSGSFTKYSVILPDGTGGIDQASRYTVTRSGNNIWLCGTINYRLECNESQKTFTVLNIYILKAKELPREKMIKNYDHILWAKMIIDKSGREWMFSNVGLYLLDEKTRSFNEYTGKFPNKEFSAQEMLYWGDLTGGLNIYRPESEKVISIPVATAQLLKNVAIEGRNVIWYSNTSLTGNPLGLSRIIFTPDYFKKYNADTETDKLPAVYSVCVDNQKRVWLGIRGRDHIVIITPENSIIKKYTPASHMPGYYGPIRSLKPVKDGIWIGFFYEMLLFYDYKTENFREIKAGTYYYRALEVRSDGKLYTGNTQLILLDPVTLKKQVFCDSLYQGGNFRFTLEKDGTLWSGMPAGSVLRYIPSENRVTIFIQKNVPNNVEDICPGENGDIWLALLGGGLVRYNTLNGSKRIYTTNQGLSNNTIYCILRDHQGNIWVSTDEGISRLNPATGTIKKFGPAEGLDIVEFNSGASFVDEEGRFYFGGMGGAVSFNPDSINLLESDAADSRVILSGLAVSGKTKTLERPVYKTDTIILDPGEDNFHITMAISDFAYSEKTDYRYRLTGHDKMWIVTDHLNRNINYVNLDPGTYTLEIEATDRNGEWNTSRDLVIRVKPYFYQRKIFFAGISLFVLGLFYLLIRLYLRNLKIKNRHIQDELRLQALRGQMNPHFIFNSLNSINYFISNNDKISANRYIADFSRLIRTILSNMGNDYVPMSAEIDSVRDYLEIEHLRFGDKFDYKVDMGDLGDVENFLVFPGLIQPFIENAIWHGVRALETRKGFISIRLTKAEKGMFSCIIEDDGIGCVASGEIRNNSKGHKSRGIDIVTERLQIISKMRGIFYSLEISDLYTGRKETGTRVRVDLPTKYVN